LANTLLHSWWLARTRWERAAITIWCAVLLVVGVRVFLGPTKRTVYPIFSGSAQLWWNGEDLYEPGRPKTVQEGYRYSPTFAILMTPLAVLPDSVGGVLWRLANTAALIAALAWLANSVLPLPLSRGQFAVLTLLCLPLAVQSVNNGQANVIVIAAMLATVAAVKEERWNLACALMMIAFVCKVYPLALGMLLIALYPRQLWWRMSLAVAGSLLLPFLFQHPGYVVDQYEKWFTLLAADDRTHTAPQNKYRDLWLLIESFGIPLSRRGYQLLQVLGGVGIAILSWHRQRQSWPTKELLTSTLALAVTWMVVLGPGVESSTFLLVAPSLAWSILAAVLDREWAWRKLLLLGSALLFVTAVLVGSIANTADLHLIDLHPLAGLFYFVYLLTETPSLALRAKLPANPTGRDRVHTPHLAAFKQADSV
jgi:alpha-1,2-mannosyltransferase